MFKNKKIENKILNERKQEFQFVFVLLIIYNIFEKK